MNKAQQAERSNVSAAAAAAAAAAADAAADAAPSQVAKGIVLARKFVLK